MASLSWLDLTAHDRKEMRKVLDLFNEKGTMDEMGLGTIRDAFSDALFPGTSSVQTRLRYFLFIPWLYEHLERKSRHHPDIRKSARTAEINLIHALKQSDDTDGIIGGRAGKGLSILPSQIYWAGMIRWGIFQSGKSKSWYHTNFHDLAARAGRSTSADDPGVTWLHEPTWAAMRFSAPKTFPKEASFALSREEALFMQECISLACKGTLLGWLAKEGSRTPATQFWSDPDTLRAPPRIQTVAEQARRFSLHVNGSALLYNLMLAERRLQVRLPDEQDQRNADQKLIDNYRQRITTWAMRESQEASFKPNELEDFLIQQGRAPKEPLMIFLRAWTTGVAELGPDAIGNNEALRRLVQAREEKLKGRHRSRFCNDGRLLSWTGDVGTTQMDFRWFRVKQLLKDLHEGLAR